MHTQTWCILSCLVLGAALGAPADELEAVRDAEKELEAARPGLNSSMVVTVHTDHEGNLHVQKMHTIVVPKDFMSRLDHFDEDDSMVLEESHEDEEVGVEKRSCDVWDSSGCSVADDDGTVFFTMRIKQRDCEAGRSNINLFRFFAKLPGIYIFRFVNKRGSYVFVMRTYKANQVLNFPLGVHVSYDSKGYLLVHKQLTEFGWRHIELPSVLKGYVERDPCSDGYEGDFRLIRQRPNYAMLEQMAPFDRCGFINVGKCIFFPAAEMGKHGGDPESTPEGAIDEPSQVIGGDSVSDTNDDSLPLTEEEILTEMN